MPHPGYIYVASPYTDESSLVRSQRYWLAVNFCSQLLGQHIVCYSPIVHWHHVAIRHNLAHDSTYWSEANAIMLDGSAAVYILRLDGWKESIGVQDEIARARMQRKPVEFWAELLGTTPQFERVPE